MRMMLMLFFAVIYLSLLTGCGGGAGIVISMVPVGVGLAVIGLGMVISAFIRSLLGGGEE